MSIAQSLDQRMTATQAGNSSRSTLETGYLPDFCSGRVVLVTVLAMEMIAILLVLSRHALKQSFWLDLALISLFLLWISLGSAFVLCRLRPWLGRLSTPAATAWTLALLIAVTVLVSESAYWVGDIYGHGGASRFFPSGHLGFLGRNVAISAIVSALMLRYFYVAHQWRANVQLEARSRIDALQARIRPHFLFNSMNTIAELTRTDPEIAEQAVEDLADLFRASLSDQHQHIRLKDELEMARMYQRIEQLRLGDRLTVQWKVDDLPMRALIPALTLQPLLENAIYHGIEGLPKGGTIRVEGGVEKNRVLIRITNPVSPTRPLPRRSGNNMALANIRQRMALAYDGRAGVEVTETDAEYRVSVRFPLQERRP